MRRVYLETSVWGMLPANQNPALRLPTLQFLEQCRRRIFLPCISDVVLDEIDRAPRRVQQTVTRGLDKVDPVLLPLSEQIEALARSFIDEGVVPRGRLDDARHVACALLHGLDLMVSWNYRHLANVGKAEGFNAVAVLRGARAGLEIHTPLEVLQWK